MSIQQHYNRACSHDSTITTVSSCDYDPFGNITVAEGPEADENPFRFSTKYIDTETGLSYYGYRYYSALSESTLEELETKGFVRLSLVVITDISD